MAVMKDNKLISVMFIVDDKTVMVVARQTETGVDIMFYFFEGKTGGFILTGAIVGKKISFTTKAVTAYCRKILVRSENMTLMYAKFKQWAKEQAEKDRLAEEHRERIPKKNA